VSTDILKTDSLIKPELRKEIEQLMAQYPMPKSAILPALHRVQEELGWVPEPAQEELAEIFGIAPQDVQSLVTFYYMYHREPVGRYVLKVCRSISCHLCGAAEVIKHLEQKLEIKLGETTPDGEFTLVGGECLAACTGAPCLQVNDRFFENASNQKLDDLLSSLKSGDPRYPKAVASWQPPAKPDNGQA
jgi:NADH-quinone oxidoreductase subunit E